MQIASNQVVTQAQANAARWAAATGGGGAFVQATFKGAAYSGVALAVPGFGQGHPVTSSGTWYVYRQTSAGGVSGIAQKDAGLGSYTTLVGSGPKLVAGDVIRLEYDGTALKAFRNGVQVLTVTPSTPLDPAVQPYVGMIYGANTGGLTIFDDWSGGDLSVTPVSTTRAASWKVRQRVATTVGTTWAVRTRIPKTIPTSWAVGGKVTRTKATTWAVRTSVTPTTRAASWKVRKQVISTTRVVSWHTLASVAPATWVASWAVRAAMAPATRAASWAVRKQVTPTRQASWKVAGATATATRVASWKVRRQVTTTRTTRWRDVLTVVRTRATTWTTRARAATTRNASWRVRTPLGTSRGTSWRVRSKVSITRGTRWKVAAPTTAVGTTRPTTWHFVSPVEAVAKSAIWGVRKRVTATRATTWKARRAISTRRYVRWSTRVITVTLPTLATPQPYYVRDRQDWAVTQERMRHNQALFTIGEYAMFVLMWHIADFNAGLVARCQRCRPGADSLKTQVAEAYNQPEKHRCPDCFGTTFEGGFKARIVRPAIFSDADEDEQKQARGVSNPQDLSVESSTDFRVRSGDYVFRTTGDRYQLRVPNRVTLRTGFGVPHQSQAAIGYNHARANQEDKTSVAFIIPPSPEQLDSMLNVAQRMPHDFSALEIVRAPLIPQGDD